MPVLSNLFMDVIAAAGQGMCRYKNTLGTVGCCPFDSPFPAIVVFLSTRAFTSFLSVLSLSPRPFSALSQLPLPPPSALSTTLSYFLTPSTLSFFRSQLSALPRDAERNTSRVRVRAWRWTLRRFNERYYDLVALDIAHINPRGTLILENPELSWVVPTRAGSQSRGEFINRSRKKEEKRSAPRGRRMIARVRKRCAWIAAATRKIKRSVRRCARNSRP